LLSLFRIGDLSAAEQPIGLPAAAELMARAQLLELLGWAEEVLRQSSLSN
jgi:hypothetical protein